MPNIMLLLNLKKIIPFHLGGGGGAWVPVVPINSYPTPQYTTYLVPVGTISVNTHTEEVYLVPVVPIYRSPTHEYMTYLVPLVPITKIYTQKNYTWYPWYPLITAPHPNKFMTFLLPWYPLQILPDRSSIPGTRGTNK